MGTVLVQMADKHWTMQAVHLACAMARSTGSQVVLLHLMMVKNPGLLGSELGTTPPTPQEAEQMEDCAAIAEDYGAEMTVQPMQYDSLVEALLQAAEHVNADAVFARVPECKIQLWRRFQLWSLRQRLAAQRRQLYTLDQPAQTDEWVPAVTLKSTK